MAPNASLSIFADYFQIYLCDPDRIDDWSALWNDQSLDDRVVACPHTVVFCTGRNMDVPVVVFRHDTEPDLAALIAPADHAVVAGLTCANGTLKLAGLTDYLPNAYAIDIGNGCYNLAFLSFGLGKIDPVDGLDGDDRYELHLWPAAAVPTVSVPKRWTEPPRPWF